MQNIYKDIYTLQNNNRSYLPTSECSLLISVLCFLAPTCHPALLPSSTLGSSPLALWRKVRWRRRTWRRWRGGLKSRASDTQRHSTVRVVRACRALQLYTAEGVLARTMTFPKEPCRSRLLFLVG